MQDADQCFIVHQSVRGQAVQLPAFLRHPQIARSTVKHPQACFRGIRRQAEALFTHAQRLLDFLDFHTIDADADLVVPVIDSRLHAGKQVRDAFPVLVSIGRVTGRTTLAEDLGNLLLDERNVFILEELRPFHPFDIIRRITGNFLYIFIPLHHIQMLVHDIEHGGNRLDDRFREILFRPQLPFRFLPFLNLTLQSGIRLSQFVFFLTNLIEHR